MNLWWTATRNSYDFVIRVGAASIAYDGTMTTTGARCLLSDTPIPFEYIRGEGKSGRINTRMMAIVAEGKGERVYLPPLPDHISVATSAAPSHVPETDLPEQALGFRVQGYGIRRHRDLFTNRQLVALSTFSHLIQETRNRCLVDAESVGRGKVAESYANSIALYLAFAVDRSTSFWCSLCVWANQPKNELVTNVFGRQTLSMVWDFAEANPFSDSGGNVGKNVDFVAKAITGLPCGTPGLSQQADATNALVQVSSPLICTDPPYYDNIGYADLSDFYYVWLRQSVGTLFPQVCNTVLTPKSTELIANPFRFAGDKDATRKYFEDGLTRTFELMSKIQIADYPLPVFYAFKQSEDDSDASDEGNSDTVIASTGWETILEGLITGGFSITGTWPIRTERPGRLRETGSNALASSIVLVCRLRSADASLATRKEFITALRRELPKSLRNLQRGNIAPVDLAQAAIGPGMAVFTRYAKVHGKRRLTNDSPHRTGHNQPGARRSARRAGRGVRRRHPLGAGVVRAVRHG